ncbi:MAG TPA: sigma 54-interacting transcriptional regulator [Blastocatellia bacterium]|nr:sigma 54-interacting transcriptional regulator [Blastocatellia bacterium]
MIVLLAHHQFSANRLAAALLAEGIGSAHYQWDHALRELPLPQPVERAVLIASAPGILDIGKRTKEARLQLGSQTHLMVCTLKLTESERETLGRYGADTVITSPTLSPEDIAERIMAELISQGEIQPSSFGLLLGATRQMRQIYNQIETLAGFNDPVLILGETGTGKDLIAREIHQRSQRPGPFQKLNCADYPPELLRSELLGHARGAFSGAHQAKSGLMAEAGRGTLFLDEIGELDIQAQAMLLQVVEDRKFRAVGSNTLQDFNARLVLATHRNLEQLVEQNHFRQDLLARIYGLTIFSPPLRERRADIPLLVHHFIEEFNHEYPDRQAQIPAGVLDCLFESAWPENIRQLRKVVRNAAIFKNADGTISAANLQHEVGIMNRRQQNRQQELKSLNSTSFDPSSDTWQDAMRRLQKAYLTAVLNHTHGNREAAIKISGLGKSRFYELLRELEI